MRLLTTMEDVRLAGHRLDLTLRRFWAFSLLAVLLGLLSFTEWLFYEYLGNQHWNVPGSTVDVWLSATVVQLVGLAAIIVHYLFPRRDRSSRGATE